MEEKDRQQEIHEKGFNITSPTRDYSSVKVGTKTLDDAILNLGALKMNRWENRKLGDKATIMRALAEQDEKKLCEISNYFYRISGVYQKIVNYFATMYRYDWYIVPEIYEEDGLDEKDVINRHTRLLTYMDNSDIKQLCYQMTLITIKEGAYYGYLVDAGDSLVVQQLPLRYCRSRYCVGTNAAVEMNMRFFDDKFPDPTYRLKVLKLFPKEVQKGYVAWKKGKLAGDDYFDEDGWLLLDPSSTIKISLYGRGIPEIPYFVNAIPAIIDLDEAQDLDKRKQAQELERILVQKLPRDKNDDLIFDNDEARDIHNNAVQMLRHAIGVDIITTFADIDDIDLSSSATSSQTDSLSRTERQVYEAAGVSRNLFDTEGNLALEKSILNDEGTLRDLKLQFARFFDRITQDKSTASKKKYKFRFYMLETTQYNYKDLSKMYKEQMQNGTSKMLPQIALGHSQSEILNAIKFENNYLHLSSIMIPPLMSSTLSGQDILGTTNKTTQSNTQTNSDEVGRPAKDEGSLSEKTIANKESMG